MGGDAVSWCGRYWHAGLCQILVMEQRSYERLVVVWHPASVSQTELIYSSSFIFSIHFLRCGSDNLSQKAQTQGQTLLSCFTWISEPVSFCAFVKNVLRFQSPKRTHSVLLVFGPLLGSIESRKILHILKMSNMLLFPGKIWGKIYQPRYV